MAHVKIWVHSVWGTKNHKRVLTREFRQKLFTHIREHGKEKGVYVDCINGDMDHVHCLLALNADMSIAKAMQMIKGEASHWANASKLMNQKLDWANEYFAVSVSESMTGKVRSYIGNQEEHHKRTTFANECEKFLKRYEFESQG